MRTVESLSILNIPADYQSYITEYIRNISGIPFVSRVILFGSCARAMVKRRSDIDIFITTNRDISEDEEMLLTFHCLPPFSSGTIPIDIIVQSESIFESNANQFGMIQKQVDKYGVDISELLRQRAGD